jgi:hypothetical protein
LKINGKPPAPAEPLRRLLDPSQPFCREDVLWALHHMKRKAAEGAPEWSELDQPQLLEYFKCFADMALILLNRQTPDSPETACFRDMLKGMLARETS